MWSCTVPTQNLKTRPRGADADCEPSDRGEMVLEENANRTRASKADGWMENASDAVVLLNWVF